MNTFGNIFRLTTFGESHGPAIGGIIDGMPPMIKIDLEAIQVQMARRRPGQSPLTTARNEADQVRILSGLLDGTTTGAPIGFIIENTDTRKNDYDWLRHNYRPSHADFTYAAKYGIRHHEGGGRASARETAVRVAAGSIARQLLATRGITISSRISRIGAIADPTPRQTAAEIARVKALCDTIGGVIECRMDGVPPGWGEPLARKLSAMLASAMMSIPAAKGFEIGMGFDGCLRLGSETIDEFTGAFTTATNNSGGIQGGISNGMPITCRVAIKPIATIMRPIRGSDDQGNPVTLQPRGRHDVCALP
nr:chorismate synthase [Muribaculaceae bacterium]